MFEGKIKEILEGKDIREVLLESQFLDYSSDKYHDPETNDLVWYKYVPKKFFDFNKYEMVDGLDYDIPDNVLRDIFGIVPPVFFVDITKPFYFTRDEYGDIVLENDPQIEAWYLDPKSHKMKKTILDENAILDLWLNYGVIYPKNEREL